MGIQTYTGCGFQQEGEAFPRWLAQMEKSEKSYSRPWMATAQNPEIQFRRWTRTNLPTSQSSKRRSRISGSTRIITIPRRLTARILAFHGSDPRMSFCKLQRRLYCSTSRGRLGEIPAERSG